MTEGITTVAGIEIPSTDPVFLSIVAIHVPLGLLCVVTGAIAMLSTKGPGRHPRLGTIYYWSVAAIFASATVLSIMRWAHNYHLFLLTAFYVDLGHQLPLWKELTVWTYLTLPALFGAPIIVWEFLNHPVAKQSDTARTDVV